MKLDIRGGEDTAAMWKYVGIVVLRYHSLVPFDRLFKLSQFPLGLINAVSKPSHLISSNRSVVSGDRRADWNVLVGGRATLAANWGDGMSMQEKKLTQWGIS